MSNGYVKLHRKLREWEWYQDANTYRLFLHLLMGANHKDGDWQGRTIKRGQLVTGRKMLSVELKMSERSIRTAFEHLLKTQEVTIKTTNRFSLVTLVNYDYYQSDKTKTTSQSANKRPANDQLTTTNKNVKNDNNEKKRDINTCANAQFDDFWKAYPIKRDKKKAKTAWMRKKLNGKSEDIVKDVINRISNDPQWIKGYIPLPTTYINGERWDDELTNPVIRDGRQYEEFPQ